MAKKAQKAKPKATKKGISFRLSKQNKIILGSLLMLFSVALFFSFLSFYFTWQDDQSLLTEFSDRNAQAENLLNKFGANISHIFMYKGFGLASFIFTFLFFMTGLHMFLDLKNSKLLKKWIWGLVLVIWISMTLGFFTLERPLLGGLVGYEMNDFLQDYAGKIGLLLLLLFGLIIILVRLFKLTPDGIATYLGNKGKSVVAEFKKPTLNEEDWAAEMSSVVESPIVIDTYTHKKDIPVLKNEEDDLPMEIAPNKKEEEKEIAMEIGKITEEKEEKDGEEKSIV